MKKLIIFFAVITIFHNSYSQNFLKIDIDLQEEMQARTSDELIRINIIMTAQHEQNELRRKVGNYSAKEDKRFFVINELKNYSKTTQQNVMNYLDSLAQNESVTEIKSFWIFNGINCCATKGVIETLSYLDDILIIGFDKLEKMIPDYESSPAESTREIPWNVTKVKADSVWNLGYNGEGVIVGVFDTGVNYNHNDLKNQMWTHPNFPYHGWNFVDNNNNPMDNSNVGHGTYCAGIVAGNGTAGTQTGMAPEATIMALRVLDNTGYGIPSDVCSAMEFAIMRNVHIFSMSIGWRDPTAATRLLFRNAMVNVLEAGVIASVAAGNEGDDFDEDPIPQNVRTPGDCPPPWLHPDQTTTGGLSAVVSVGSTDINDTIAKSSSNGHVTWQDVTGYNDYPYDPGMGLIRPDVCAPGVNIKSCSRFSNSGYFTSSGTSAAAPCVAGIIALMLSKNRLLTPAEICKIIETKAVNLPFSTSSKGNIYGSGRIDAYSAMLATPEMCDNGLPIASGSITQNTTWNTPVFANNITVKSGATLIVTSTVICYRNASITILPGGKLIIDGGTLTNACAGEMWRGITVMGDATKPMTQNNQGYLQIINNGVIENAECGITVKGGGMVEATNADIVNNTTQIKFEAVASGQAGTSGILTNTNFEINSNYIDNQANFAGHLLMDKCGDVQVTGCNFTNPVSTNANTGIVVENTHTIWSGNSQLLSVPVEIRQRGTLTIRDTLKCNENTKITVQPGGKLIVSGGTMSNIGNKLWKGITVLGDLNLPPIQNYQGYIQILNNGKIENAQCGITVKGGGLVNVSNAHFVNNTIGVFFNLNAGGGTFTQTNFILNNNYLGETGSGANGDMRDFVAHLKMQNSREVSVMGCNFSSTAPLYYNYKNKGIEAINTNLVLKEYCPPNALIDPQTGFCDASAMIRNYFSGFFHAIHSSNAGTLPKLKVRFSYFSGNYSGGIYTMAQNYPELIKNEFIIDKTSSYGLSVGKSTGYKIEENYCRNLSPVPNLQNIGLRVTDSWIDENEVYKNVYNNLDIAQQFLGKNSSQIDTLSGPGGPNWFRGNPVTGLQTLCNDFSNSQSMDILVGDWNNPNPNNNLNSIRDKQGNSQLSAGNKFNNTNPPINIDNRLSQHAIDYYWSIPVEKPNTVAGTVSPIKISNTNRCPSKLGTLIIHNREGENGEDLELALAQYDEWNAEYEYWLAELLACKGNHGEECNMIFDKVSYLSGLKNNFFNSIIVWVLGKEKAENDIEAGNSIIETLRLLFTYRGSYSDYLNLTETYLAENNHTVALATLAQMYEQFKVTEEQFSELKGFEIYIRWLQKLQEEQKNIYELFEKEIDYLKNFVENNTGRGVVFANNILCLVYNICLDKFEPETTRQLTNDTIRCSTMSIISEQLSAFRLVATLGKQFIVDWGDGTPLEVFTGTGMPEYLDHRFSQPDRYRVTTSGSENCYFTKYSFCGADTLDFSSCPSIIRIDDGRQIYGGGPVRSLNTRNCSNLEFILVPGNQLTVLDLRDNIALISLKCQDNQLTHIDLVTVERIMCYGNRLPLSNLYTISEMISERNNKGLGEQELITQRIVEGNPVDFSTEKEFGGIATVFQVEKDDLQPEDYTIQDGIITFHKSGFYRVIMTNDAIVSHPKYPVEVVAPFEVIPLGITQTEHYPSVQVFPNPTTGELKVTSYGLKVTNVEVFDVYGRNHTPKTEHRTPQTAIDISHLQSGLYFVKISTRQGEVVKKIVKQ
jgi:subtilisin family serine protease